MRSISETTDMLIQWCDERGVTTGIDEFITYLQEISSDYLLPHILDELDARSEESSYYNELHVTGAVELTKDEVESLQSGFGAAASKTERQTNTNLLAGVSCEYKGIQIKDNLHGRLQALQNRLYIN